ncbi:hypothetical protein ACFV42_49075 [Streptomyces solisilvae]|uniref:hypothetical protein n=1 Tax=Streptomyces malaysiensis TaxID=92644 RepID=UPI003689D2B2
MPDPTHVPSPPSAPDVPALAALAALSLSAERLARHSAAFAPLLADANAMSARMASAGHWTVAPLTTVVHQEQEVTE